MFEYLEPIYQEAILSLNVSEFTQFIKMNGDKLERILSALPAEISKYDFWADVIYHYFQLPTPYYLAGKEMIFYLLQLEEKIYQFNQSTSMREKQSFIETLLSDNQNDYLAICCSLSLVYTYKAAGHLVCINTYEAILAKSAANERNLYATQIYSHA